MTVKAILDEKGRDVATMSPGKSLLDAAELLGEKRIVLFAFSYTMFIKFSNSLYFRENLIGV